MSDDPIERIKDRMSSLPKDGFKPVIIESSETLEVAFTRLVAENTLLHARIAALEERVAELTAQAVEIAKGLTPRPLVPAEKKTP